jgi:broad specificity phosphatase PhoE
VSVVPLVRHAAHDNLGGFLAGRMPGVRLGDAGRAQAERLAKRVVAERLDAIETSPRERAGETAEAIARACGSPKPRIAAALDKIDFGSWAGKDFQTLNADPAWREWNARRATARTPAGESMADAHDRSATETARRHSRSRRSREGRCPRQRRTARHAPFRPACAHLAG